MNEAVIQLGILLLQLVIKAEPAIEAEARIVIKSMRGEQTTDAEVALVAATVQRLMAQADADAQVGFDAPADPPADPPPAA